MTPHSAMGYAIDAAGRGETEAGRLWLDIARELRAGWVSVPSPAGTVGDRTEVLRPGSAVDADDECRHCGYAIRLVRQATIGGLPPLYVHTRTDGAMCPAENADSWMRERTHAEPKVVASD